MVRILENVRGEDVYLIQPIALHPNDEFVELLFWMDAFKRASAESVTAIVPFFGYAKGDKKDEPRVSIRARLCAECIELAGADRIVTMDLHSPQVQGFFRKPVDHLFALPVLCEYIEKLKLPEFVVVSPDTGFTKGAHRYARRLGAKVAIGDKVRKGHSERAELLSIVGEVAGKDALVVDDFSISGRTLVDTARALKERGARRVYACLSHLLLTADAVRRIEESDIDLIVGSDTVENSAISATRKIRTVSVAPLFAEAVMRVHARTSVSILFDQVPARVLQQVPEPDAGNAASP